MATKFTYDTANKRFILNVGVTSLDAKTEFYAWVKHDWLTDDDLNRLRFPIEPIGGQDIGGGSTISPYFNLLYGWRLQFAPADQAVQVVGNIITAEGDSPIVENPGPYHHVYIAQVSANSLTSSGGGSLTADEVWDLTNGVEPSLTPRQAMRLIAAALAGKVSGAASETVTFRNAVADSKDRIVADVDADGNRLSVTVDLS